MSSACGISITPTERWEMSHRTKEVIEIVKRVSIWKELLKNIAIDYCLGSVNILCVVNSNHYVLAKIMQIRSLH